MKLLLSACLLILSMAAFPQLRELRFNRLTAEDGLPENYATCHIQDKKGYHWFGTQSGLARYDGYKVKMYPLQTESGWTPTYRSVRSLIEDSSGDIWISTYREGIFRLDPTTGKCVNFRHADAASNVGGAASLIVDKEGMLWVSFFTPNLKWRLDCLDPQTGKFARYDSTGKY